MQKMYRWATGFLFGWKTDLSQPVIRAFIMCTILAAYAGVRTAGFSAEHFTDMLKKFNPENGRMEQFRIQGTGVTLNLAKNPAGFNQNISAVMQDTAPKDVYDCH